MVTFTFDYMTIKHIPHNRTLLYHVKKEKVVGHSVYTHHHLYILTFTKTLVMCGVVLSFYFKDSEDSEKDLKYEGLFTKYCFSVTYP